jgi:hypothetical protein
VPKARVPSGLIDDVYDTVRFLDSYLEGRHGYTARDVRAGAARLADLRRRIELSAPEGGPGTVRALEAADECLRRVRERLGDRG